MALKNKSIYAILGILSLSPSSGYDIKKYSDKVLSGFWNENFGHIYPTLKMMLKDGLIEIVSTEKNQKKIKYGITEKGRQELEAWLLEETIPQPMRSEFLLKLLFSSSQPKERVINMLKNYRKLHEKNLDKYLEMQKNLEQDNQDISKERACFMKAILRRGIISGEAVIRWCDETIEELQR
ncbi:MAG TPA: PadR family transcriptional regulator [Acetivibrio sp.]|uniref:PadR family transcriptional regulator n=1 Tax=Acetivibrio sp. TaxID=1872092 RepID=UPI002B9E6ECC|nr:PadR family transcriptional regulator [Acetivibrio sp.]HOM03703.1 PadR family transcriptional regulator [Acetivibrio sp.]